MEWSLAITLIFWRWLESVICYAADYGKAFASTKLWRSNLLKNNFDLDIDDPTELQQKAKHDV